ncbi:MAG TPA: 16S rRNA (guanine(966)-N(2))-methyltransferase RsmD [Acidimicrobiales bacterium]|jgi:16S rRNA (guanine966-N2)-methyltransferase|nr:16S rRNA (guanine(966)-N(2))-methyltransferase RsmD [Acidimicrobiales bacterium]
MRVVAGKVKGRNLDSPKDRGVRPTSDRVREAIFNALYSIDAIENARVLDLFAGSGALGIEALSRGSAHAVFVEKSSVNAQLIERNIEKCGLSSQAEIHARDGVTWLASNPGPWDLVLLDPPYQFDGWENLFQVLDAQVVVVESNREISPGNGWHVQRTRQYGATVVLLVIRDQKRSRS